MNNILRSLGTIIVLLGVLVLFVYYIGGYSANGWLLTAAFLFVAGIGAHIFLNKKFEGDPKDDTKE